MSPFLNRGVTTAVFHSPGITLSVIQRFNMDVSIGAKRGVGSDRSASSFSLGSINLTTLVGMPDIPGLLELLTFFIILLTITVVVFEKENVWFVSGNFNFFSSLIYKFIKKGRKVKIVVFFGFIDCNRALPSCT